MHNTHQKMRGWVGTHREESALGAAAALEDRPEDADARPQPRFQHLIAPQPFQQPTPRHAFSTSLLSALTQPASRRGKQRGGAEASVRGQRAKGAGWCSPQPRFQHLLGSHPFSRQIILISVSSTALIYYQQIRNMVSMYYQQLRQIGLRTRTRDRSRGSRTFSHRTLSATQHIIVSLKIPFITKGSHET